MPRHTIRYCFMLSFRSGVDMMTFDTDAAADFASDTHADFANTRVTPLGARSTLQVDDDDATVDARVAVA